MGVTLHKPDAVARGLNLYVSGHAPEAILMDMEGEVLHEWNLPLEEAFPGAQSGGEGLYWRRARLIENGDLLVIYEYQGIARIDSDSNLVWATHRNNHHDLDVAEDGSLYVLGHRTRVNPRLSTRKLIGDDLIIHMDADGQILSELSVYDCFANSDYVSILNFMGRQGDVFHTNTLTILDGSLAHRLPHFRQGNLLISVRELNTVAVVDPEAGKVVWAITGLWVRQHEPVLLDSGSLMVFDNNVGADFSRIVELDPLTQDILWEYRGTERKPFYSRIGGAAQRLANGNTLIVESDHGRVIEVNPRGGIVWEFLSPHRAGPDDELVAVLFDMVRLDPALPALSFLRRHRPE